MLRQLMLLLITCLTAGLVLSACTAKSVCSDPLGCVVVEGNDPLIIAAAFPLSGEELEWGNAALGALEDFAADQELLLGHPIAIVKEDLICANVDREDAIIRLTGNENLIAVIETPCQIGDEQLIKAINAAGIPQIVLPRGEQAVALVEDTAHQLVLAVETTGNQIRRSQAVVPRQVLIDYLHKGGILPNGTGLWDYPTGIIGE